MLEELLVENIGVISKLQLTFSPGMVVFSGETGAGKTLIVDAIELLFGKAFPATFLRSGSTEARIESRFVEGDEETIITRVFPKEGRARSYVNNKFATKADLDLLRKKFVEVYGQHEHQLLLSKSAQRKSLDTFGAISLEKRSELRQILQKSTQQLREYGGDERERARTLDLLRFQYQELLDANLVDPQEDEDLNQKESDLLRVDELRDDAKYIENSLISDDGVIDTLRNIRSLMQKHPSLSSEVERVESALQELFDIGSDLRNKSDEIDQSPQLLENIRIRRQLFADLKRKYGANLSEIISYRDDLVNQIEALVQHDSHLAELEKSIERTTHDLHDCELEILEKRRNVAPKLSEKIQALLPDLALGRATFCVEVEGNAGDDVSFLFSANPGSSLQPLSHVGSGGELARIMLALRLVLHDAPPVLVFDEVDAGIGGKTAQSVGKALSELANRHQVFVVTHLAQVAVFADHHVVVEKNIIKDNTITNATTLNNDNRIVEIARMLSGTPDSESARIHAKELLDESKKSVM